MCCDFSAPAEDDDDDADEDEDKDDMDDEDEDELTNRVLISTGSNLHPEGGEAK